MRKYQLVITYFCCSKWEGMEIGRSSRRRKTTDTKGRLLWLPADTFIWRPTRIMAPDDRRTSTIDPSDCLFSLSPLITVEWAYLCLLYLVKKKKKKCDDTVLRVHTYFSVDKNTFKDCTIFWLWNWLLVS